MNRIPLFLKCIALILISVGLSYGGDNQPREIKGWGVVTDPDGDCTVKEAEKKVTIMVPGTFHDLNPSRGKVNAPKVMQTVEGDFVVQVSVSADLQPGMKSTSKQGYPFNGAGLLIWGDQKNYIRLERNVWLSPNRKLRCYAPLFEVFKDGRYQGTNPPESGSEFFKGKATYLRLERKGDKVSAAYSHDGKDWVGVKEVATGLPAKVQVGVAALNTSDTPFQAEFAEFELTKKEK